MTEPDETVAATTVRIEPSLRRQIERAAKASFRSVSGEVCYRLRASFERISDTATAS